MYMVLQYSLQLIVIYLCNPLLGVGGGRSIVVVVLCILKVKLSLGENSANGDRAVVMLYVGHHI
jgi:hypothetical protein